MKRVRSGYICLCGYWARRAIERDLHLKIESEITEKTYVTAAKNTIYYLAESKKSEAEKIFVVAHWISDACREAVFQAKAINRPTEEATRDLNRHLLKKVGDIKSEIDGHLDGAPDASEASKLANRISRIIS